jgi:hypothetical protein
MSRHRKAWTEDDLDDYDDDYDDDYYGGGGGGGKANYHLLWGKGNSSSIWSFRA